MNFLLDCKIIIFTLMKVVKSEGVSQQGHVTMTKFEGN
jgi:sugar transferase EpsL